MCAPLPLLGFAASAASSGLGFMGQSAQAKAQEQEYQVNQNNAYKAFGQQAAQINTQQEQQQDQIATQKQNNDLQTRAAQAQAEAGAAAGGVQGISVNEILQGYTAQDARTNSALTQQGQWEQEEGQQQKMAAADQTVSRINSVAPGVAPSPIAPLLQVGTAGINAMSGQGRITAANQGMGFGGVPGIPLGSFGNLLPGGLSIPGLGS